MLILGSLYTLCWVSLIAGVEYRVQWWGGEWDGMMGVAITRVTGTLFKVVLARALTSSQRLYGQVQCCHLF